MNQLYESQELWELKGKLADIIIQLLDDPHYEKKDAALNLSKILDQLNSGSPPNSFERMVEKHETA